MSDLDLDQPWLEALHWDAEGLIPVVAQDAETQAVLMFAWMNRQALEETLRTGEAVYWSRSRARLWRKGEASGHTQQVRTVHTDCDGDVLLLSIVQRGGIACHTGRQSCFFHLLQDAHWVTDAPVLKPPQEIYGK